MKDWGGQRWREFLSKVLPSDGRPAVFLGNTKEWESIEKIRSDRYRSINLASDPPPIPVSLALASMSCGYVGRDSGVMHMACATGRPVHAVFGGGHCGRFLPSSGPAVVVTQAMSCRMCDFACPHEQPHCITEVRMETMLNAWERLPHVTGIEIMEQAIDARYDTVPADVARAFAMSRAGELRERESSARASSWRRFLPKSGKKK
ncbi:MAG: glycosyltransferase family 9 protein, partial [Verrucomicrobiota bacterium]